MIDRVLSIIPERIKKRRALMILITGTTGHLGTVVINNLRYCSGLKKVKYLLE
jgi:hypothetical protein